MYFILVYDAGQKRNVKLLKLCRTYLNHIQNSVFEGDLTEVQMNELKLKINDIIDENDSVIIFQLRSEKWVKRDVLGHEKNELTQFL